MTARLDVSTVPLQGGYIAKRCPVVAHHANDPTLDVELVPPSPAVQLRFDRGNVFEEEVFSELIKTHPEAVVIDRDLSRTEREDATVRAMREGAPLVVRGRLPADEAGRRVGEPDLLLRGEPVEGGTTWLYLPVDVKHHLTLREVDDSFVTVSLLDRPDRRSARAGVALRPNEGDVLQLAHYHRMLETAGYASPARLGGIVGKEKVVVWYDLDEPVWLSGGRRRTALERYDFEFGFRLDVAATAMQRAHDPSTEPLVVPVRIDQCDECEWWGVCGPVLEEIDDVSLLPRVGWPQWRDLNAEGVTTREALAGLDWQTASLIDQGVDVRTYMEEATQGEPSQPVADVIGARRTRQVALLNEAGFHTAADASRLDPATVDVAYARGSSPIPSLSTQIDTARARIGPESAYRRRGVDEVNVPRAHIEVDVDMENSADNQAYLWGVLITKAGAEPVYQSFVTWELLDPEGVARREVFLRFWEWLSNLVDDAESEGQTVAVYCYSRQAEETQMRGTLGEGDDGVREAVETFLASPRWVDLYRVFDTQLITGDRVGLKMVAALAGFTWRDEDPGGAQSMVWYEQAVQGDEESRERLLAYNEDDVLATLALRDWLTSSDFPSIADLDSTRPSRRH